MSNQKILIIRNAAHFDFGGGERFPVFLAEQLQKQLFSPIIISRSKMLIDFAEMNNIPTIKGLWWKKQNWNGINNLLIPVYVVWQIILTFYYRRLFTRLKPSVVHIQSKDDFIAATRAAKALGIRVIWTDHADLKHIWQNLTLPYKNPIGKMIYKAAHNTHAITVVSDSELKLVSAQLPKNSAIQQKLQVIHNGVVDSATNLKPKKNNTFTYLVASRLVKDKGIQEAIDAFTELYKIYPSTQLQIIGDGPDAELFTEVARQSPAISILGHQDQPLQFMANADVFVHPTYHEGFSVALVEAGMMSLPIIATAVGGNIEIIKNEETGLLVQAKNSNELFVAMKTIYENESLRKKISTNARKQYLEKFQFDIIIAEHFIPLYRGDL